MKTKTILAVLGLEILLGAIFTAAHAQQPQIPTLQVCNQTSASGKAVVHIASRTDATHSGSFEITVEIKCDPKDGYPTGKLAISNISMSDSTVQGTLTATVFEQVTSTGKHSPTVYLNGRCRAENVAGCRFWLMMADNGKGDPKGTPDIVGFLVFDGLGKRVAYGTGPVVKGDIVVGATSN